MVETIMRTQGAITTLPFIKPESEELLTEWLNQMLFPMNPTLDTPQIGLSTTIDATKVTCWADNDQKILAKQLAEFMTASKFNETELKILRKAFKSYPEGKLAAWLELSEGSQETGWAFDGVLPLSTAFTITSKSAAKERLEAWYASFEANACVRVGRSIAGNRFTILHSELFGANVEEDMQLYLDLMNKLELSPLPEVLLEMMMDEDPEYLELSFWLGASGVLKAGLVMPEPSADFVRRLSIAYAEEAADSLAAFEGSIGRESPKSIELARVSSGVQIELIY